MKIIKIIIATFLLFSVTFTVVYGNKQIYAERITAQTENYKGVISLWQIDSFEGGVGSRKQFLLKVARGFEKIHNGVLVMVVNMTKEGAEENFKNGIFPDLISYGNGLNLQNASEFTTPNTVNGGKVGNKTFATAWCRGGYALIKNPNFKKANKEDTLVVSQAKLTCPLVCLAMSELTINNVETLAPMDAYVKFVSGKVEYMLGTQRDVNRLESRGMEVEITPFNEFNDLYQYISISSTDSLKRYYAEQFIEYLTSKKVQEKLNEIGMLSCFYNVEFQNEHLRSLQKQSVFSTLSAFTPEESIKEIQRLSVLAVYGNEDAKIKIKNMLI